MSRSPEQIAAHEARLNEAWSLHVLTNTYDEIGEKLGVNGGTAYRLVQRAREHRLARLAGEMRAVALEQEQRLLVMFRAVWERWKEKGDGDDFDRAIAVLDKITALWQISAPALHVHAQQAIVGQVNGARNLGGLKRMLAELRAPAAIEDKTVVEASQVIEVEPAEE
jgi:hypothetical protein